MRLHLIRHLPAHVEPGTCYGRSEVACAPADPAALARLRGAWESARVISSPSHRCAELSRSLARDVIFDPRLLEIDFGDWEGRSFDAIDRTAIDAWAAAPWDFVPPNGESAAQMATRVRAVLDELLRTVAPVTVVVAHGGPLRVILGTLLGRPRAEWLALAFEPGDALTLEVDDDAGDRPAMVLARMSLRSSGA